MEKQIKAAAKFYECRESMKRLLGSEFEERITPYIEVIKSVMEKKGIDEIPALLEISKSVTYNESVIVQAMFIAATCELIEPTI